ncbi:MAG TPA: shikimate kinase [Acidimicrobiales bacterium]|nr:shikimate kinase [Acidimicrobiales bacterium]
MSGAPRVLLVGMMGSGKTTIGHLLARRLGWRHVDSDAQVEVATGRSVAQIFAEDGEAAFRVEEARALAEAVTSPDPVVVSVAGGAVLDADNRARMKGAGCVVWLRARPETLAGRVGSGAGRPLLEGDPAGNLARLDAVRRPHYEEVADHAVDVDDAAPDRIVDLIAGWCAPTGAERG